MNGPPRSSRLAKAMEWITMSMLPNSARTVWKARSTFASSLTSHSMSATPLDKPPASRSTPPRMRSLRYESPMRAPAASSARAMCQAMLRWLATPNTRAFFPARSMAYNGILLTGDKIAKALLRSWGVAGQVPVCAQTRGGSLCYSLRNPKQDMAQDTENRHARPNIGF